jgi:hypothetical protein
MDSAESWDWTPAELQKQQRMYKKLVEGVCAAYIVVILIVYVLSASG